MLTYYELYRDPGEGNVIVDSDANTTPIAFISQDIVYSQCSIIYVNNWNMLVKLYKEGTLMSKSCNIALSIKTFNENLEYFLNLIILELLGHNILNCILLSKIR